MKKRYYFWQPMPSPHQSGHLRALTALHEVHLLVDVITDPMRTAMGWSVPELDGMHVEQCASKDRILQLLSEQPQDSVNVISGFRGCRVAETVLEWSVSRRKPFAVIAEAGNHADWLRHLRRFRYGLLARQLSAHPMVIFAMGELGVRWYLAAGFRRPQVVEFGYSVDERDIAPEDANDGAPNRSAQLIFIGSLIARKGVDLLMEALTDLEGDWHLKIVGDGPERRALLQMATRAGFGERITWYGPLTNAMAMQHLRRSDVLVLPSRFDGWGAVVGEALCRGVRAIASDACGSSTLLKDSKRGFTFRSGDASQLRRALSRMVSCSSLDAQQRAELLKWGTRTQGPCLGSYLDRTMDWFLSGCGAPPSVPWNDVP